MKAIKIALLFIVSLITLQVSIAQEKFSSVKIFAPQDKARKAALLGLLEIDHYQVTPDGAVISEISEEAVHRLKNSGYRYEIVVDDVAKNLFEINKKFYRDRAEGRLAFEQTGNTVGNIIVTPSAFEVKPTFGGYYRFAEMVTAMDNLVAAYPTLAQKINLSTTPALQTHLGNNVWCIKISDNVTTDESGEPEVLFIGIQHAREAIGGASMIFFMQYLCERYAVDSRIKDLVDNREIYIIPCMNPDGWEHNYSLNNNGGGGWRKNRRDNPGTSFGVDLNRNWGVDWANCNAPIQGVAANCGSSTMSSDTYYGPSVFSEPETQAIRDFTYTRNFVAMIDQHAYGPYYSLPFGRPSLPTNVMAPEDAKFYTYVASAMGNYNGMRAGNSLEALNYEVAGGVKDWMLKGNIGTGTKGKVLGMTGEGSGGTTSATFWPPAGQIINLCKGMVFQNLQLLYMAGSYINLQDKSEMNVTSTSGSFQFHATRVGLANQPVTVSLIPIQNIVTQGNPVTFSLPNYYDTATYSINYWLPQTLGNGKRIRFAWKIETGGVTYYDTVTKFYNATPLLTDNMEGTFGTNWTSTSTRVNASGNTVAAENWSFSTNDKYSGTSSLTESASGLYDSLSTRTLSYRFTFNLSDASAAYVSFWVKHRAENFRDKLQVQASTNGSTWHTLRGTTTIEEPGTLDGSTINGQPSLTGVKPDWTREVFDMTPVLGGAAVQFRMVFTSDADGSGFDYQKDDGFYIDELRVLKSTASMVTLPVEFIDFTGRLTASNTVDLNWKAVTDEKHSHFIVERSGDGQHFEPISSRIESLPYRTTDASPKVGVNYYRVKQFDFDGNFSYSKTISIYYDPSRFSLSLYPNPASDNLTVRFAASSNERASIQVTDLSGKIVYRSQGQLSAGNETTISVQSWPAQTYIVKVVSADNAVLAVQKFVKR